MTSSDVFGVSYQLAFNPERIPEMPMTHAPMLMKINKAWHESNALIRSSICSLTA